MMVNCLFFKYLSNRSAVRILTKQVAVPSVQAYHSLSATLRSITRWMPAACGSTALRMVVAPGSTPVSYQSFSADANDTRGIPSVPQNSLVTNGLSSVVTYR